MTKKVIELIRVSTQSQAADDRGGIPAQRAANLRTVAQYGLQVVRTFEIADVSGAKVLQSSEMQEIMRLIEAPEICGVVTREFSRLMRPEDWGDYIILQRFTETRTVLYLPDGPMDFSSKSGKLFGGIRALMAGHEREEIRERMMSGKEAIRRAGRHAGGNNLLPFGVSWDKKEGWSLKPEAEKVKEAFRQVLTTTRPYAQIAAELGLPRTSLRCILQNPIWIGYRVYDSRRDLASSAYIAGENGRHGYRRKIARDPSDVIRVKVLPGLVSESDFRQVQEIFADRAARQRNVRDSHAPRYQFNGFLSCARCGELVYTHTGKAEYYICKANAPRERKRGRHCTNPYVLAAKIDDKITTVLSERLHTKDIVSQIAELYLSGQQEPLGVAGVDVEASKTLIASLEAKRSRILDAFFDGSISKPERDKRLKAVDVEMVGCNTMLVRAVARPMPKINVKQLTALLRVFVRFRSLSRDKKRSIMAATRARVFTSGYVIERIELSALKFIEDGVKAEHNGSHIDGHFPAAVSVTTPRIVIPVGW